MTTAPSLASRRQVLNGRALWLAYATAGYNLLEGLVAIGAGAAASSTALIAFGLDSFIEVSSALVVIWQFRARIPETRERLALRLIAVSFFALAAWVSVDAVTSSLVSSVGRGPRRYRLLESLRAYATQRLAASGVEPEARRAHAYHYLELAEHAAGLLRTAH